jgi:hypothetical protein
MKIPFVLEDRRVPKTAIIVEGEKAVTAKNLGRTHGNRGKTAFSTKLTAKNEKYRKRVMEPGFDKVLCSSPRKRA